MSISPSITALELGQYLAQVRERAGIKQNELAKKITWSAPQLSKIEAGERRLDESELATLLDAIGSEEAQNLKDIITRQWSVIPQPPLNHPEQEILWKAEQTINKLEKLKQDIDIKPAFERRINEYIDEIKRNTELLLKRNYQIAFVGSIGVGKSTAICRLTGLEVKGSTNDQLLPVLEVGAGGITICEVHLRNGSTYGIVVEPQSDTEIRANVADYVDYLLQSNSTDDSKDIDFQGIPKEISRAIWNMAGFKIKREKTTDEKIVRVDESKELAKKLQDHRELNLAILSRMELHKRDKRTLLYESSNGLPPLVWLKDNFEKINNGRHSDFSLPKRIEIIIPDKLLNNSDVDLKIIDTKGIDKTAIRADLENYFYQSHTLLVLCSPFSNAPASEPRLLLERARAVDVGLLEAHSTLLVLARPEEALEMRDESGIKAETATEGYDLKKDQVHMSLASLKFQSLPITFFNSREDDPNSLQDFLNRRIKKMRIGFRKSLEDILNNTLNLIDNFHTEQIQAVIQDAAMLLNTSINQKIELSIKESYIRSSLLNAISQSHPSTIRAAISRKGDWDNLDYVHHLSYGARQVAVQSLQSAKLGIVEICDTMIANPKHTEAKDFIEQFKRILLTAYEKLLTEAQTRGKESFRDRLKTEILLWSNCREEKGKGYRDRVIDHHKKWFDDDEQKKLVNAFSSWLNEQWLEIIKKLSLLLN